MIDLVLVKFLRDYTPYRAGATASFSPHVAESFKKARIAEIIGPVSKESQAQPETPENKRTPLKPK